MHLKFCSILIKSVIKIEYRYNIWTDNKKYVDCKIESAPHILQLKYFFYEKELT